MSNKSMTIESSKPKKNSCLKRISDVITTLMEEIFYSLGQNIGYYPWRYISGSIITSALCGIGMMHFQKTDDPDKLWVPSDASILPQKEWIEKNFPSTTRVGLVIGVSSNVLTPTGLVALLDLYQKIVQSKTPSGITLKDICFKAGPQCIVRSVLELWSYDNATIRHLAQKEIDMGVNSITTSPSYGGKIDLANLLGGRTTDNGNVTAASAALMTVLLQGGTNMTARSKDWEAELIKIGQAGHPDLSDTHVFALRSFSDLSSSSIQADFSKLTIGYVFVTIFVFAVLGRFNRLEQRIWLTIAGTISIGLSFMVSAGLSSLMGFAYGHLHNVLLFLLLGVGVDDMFVIVGELTNLEAKEQTYSIQQKTGSILRHAGISVTVTSLTDCVAFAIGTSTVIPALQSFCVYAALGILALYFLQAVFFTACLSLDIRRQADRRDSCLCCYKLKETYVPNKCSQTDLIPLFFRRILEPVMVLLPVKIVIAILTLGLIGTNIYGSLELRQYFDSSWFLPTDSYAARFTRAKAQYFPDDGAEGNVYCGQIDYFQSQKKFEALYKSFTSSSYIYNGTTDSWFQELTTWLSTTQNSTVIAMLNPTTKYPLTEEHFINLTFQLVRTIQPRLARNVLFSKPLQNITASKIPYQHIVMESTAKQVEALDATRALISDAQLSQCFPYSSEYLKWETNRVIQKELYRNMGLACLCVFIVTLVLIAHLATCLLVFLCVVFTLVDVAGSMHFWGLTIDTVTTIILVLAIGLAVDYSAHVGHTFMTVTGTRGQRIKETLSEIGPAVFCGGFTTFLAFIPLANSNSYVFSTFFKVFLLVVVFGLFHGLFFLPVILSWLGPDPYSSADRHFHEPDERRAATVQNISMEKLDNPASNVKVKDLQVANENTTDFLLTHSCQKLGV